MIHDCVTLTFRNFPSTLPHVHARTPLHGEFLDASIEDAMTRLVSPDPEVPLFNSYGMRIGSISVSRALELHGTDLELRAKGTGRQRRFTSAKLYARISQLWIPRDSGGFLVLQFITERK